MSREGEDRTRSLSERVYAVLLVAYPKGFRREYGPSMAQVFGDMCREARGRGGAPGLVRLWSRTLPDLVVSMASERSKAMGGALMQAGRFVTLRNLMLLNAAVLLTCGLALALAPVPMSDAYGLTTAFLDEDPKSTAGNAHLALIRFLGIVSVGFGSLLWATSRMAEVWTPRTVSGALFPSYSLGALLLLIQQTEIWVSAVGGVTVAVHLFFALGYGFFWWKGSPADVPLGASPLASTGRDL